MTKKRKKNEQDQKKTFGEPTDPARSVYRYRKAAEVGDENAMFKLGLHLAKGYGTARDFTEAAAWMEKAHKAGNPKAGKLAVEYRIMAFYLEKAREGDPDFQAAFARAVTRHASELNGLDPCIVLREAVRWYAASYRQTGDPKIAAKIELLRPLTGMKVQI